MILMLEMCQLKNQKLTEKRGTLAVKMRGFQLHNSLSRWILSVTYSRHGTTFASLAGRNHSQKGNELSTEMVLVVNGGLQIYKNTRRKHENKWSLRSEIYFRCSEMDATVSTDMNTVVM